MRGVQLINVTGFSISTGLATVCDTLFSQVSLAKNLSYRIYGSEYSIPTLCMFQSTVYRRSVRGVPGVPPPPKKKIYRIHILVCFNQSWDF